MHNLYTTLEQLQELVYLSPRCHHCHGKGCRYCLLSGIDLEGYPAKDHIRHLAALLAQGRHHAFTLLADLQHKPSLLETLG